MENTIDWHTSLLTRHRWLVFVLPFAVFMLAGSLEPTPDKPGGQDIGLAIPYSFYPWIYALKIVVTLAAIAFVWPGYREFPARITLLGVLVGIVGGPLWIVLCKLDVEHVYLLPLLERIGAGWIIGAGARAGFDPLTQLADQPAWAWTFLAIRFFGLVLVVPVIEEFFLRGFLMRLVTDGEWWKVPFGTASWAAIIVGTAVPMLMHPGELLAAAVWFSMITWLMLRTKSIWDCVVAHALTNLILGVYVVSTGTWRLM